MTLYLDTSSLVKLYAAEPGADAVRQLVDGATVVATSVVAYAETRAALARLRREGSLRARTFTSIKHSFDEDWPSYLTLDVTLSICRVAGDLAERYRLRGYDSVHLASYWEVARQAGSGETRFSALRLSSASHSAFSKGHNESPLAVERNSVHAAWRRLGASMRQAEPQVEGTE